jgi:hypothetical protein
VEAIGGFGDGRTDGSGVLLTTYSSSSHVLIVPATDEGPFGCANKPAEKRCWLICCERKILFRLKKQAKKDEL